MSEQPGCASSTTRCKPTNRALLRLALHDASLLLQDKAAVAELNLEEARNRAHRAATEGQAKQDQLSQQLAAAMARATELHASVEEQTAEVKALRAQLSTQANVVAMRDAEIKSIQVCVMHFRNQCRLGGSHADLHRHTAFSSLSRRWVFHLWAYNM